MALANAEKQRRWRERNQFVLSDSVEAIAAEPRFLSDLHM
jgi:hypothetical protein